MSEMPPQDALRDPGLTGWLGRITGIRTGKVVAVRRDSNAVDVAFLDGVIARNVPVLSAQIGASWGFASVVGPSYDAMQPVRKTYPKPSGETARIVHAPGNEAKTYRDEYVVCLQFEGSRHGQAGLVALGYLAPMVCEMMFAGGDNEHTDMVLFRSSSDVQVTVQRDGKLSVQHPSGARFTMGEGAMGAVDLEGQDLDGLYELRQNKGKKVGFHVEDTEGTWVEWDHEGNLKAFAPKNVEVEAGLKIKAVAGTSIDASAGTHIKATAGTSIEAVAAVEIALQAPIIRMAATTILLTAPTVLTPLFDLAKQGGGMVLEVTG